MRMKLGANSNVTLQSWLDYLFVGLALVGVMFLGVWQALSYLLAVLVGRSEAWK